MAYKLNIDEDILKILNKHYKADLTMETCRSLECFSEPDLSIHVCNALAPLPGDAQCSHCEHIINRLCNVTCHLSHMCLFAKKLASDSSDPVELKERFVQGVKELPNYRQLLEELGTEEDKQKEEGALTVQEVADLLNVHTVTVYNKIKTKKLKALKKGKRFFVKREALDEFQKNNTIRKRRKKGE